MTDELYIELKEMFTQEYADAARKTEHTGSQKDLRAFLRIRQEVRQRLNLEGE